MFYIYWFVGLMLAIVASVMMASHYGFTHSDEKRDK